jgi:hypothetical protein
MFSGPIIISMDDVRETLSALEQLRKKLDAIVDSEISETGRMLSNLMTDVVNVEKNELHENANKLSSLAVQLINIEKKEFSFMKVFGIENNELAHSSFLAWLLDPLGYHGLGSQFVEKFICKVASKTKNLDFSNLDFSNLCVDQEISGDESRLDIRIRDPLGSFICIIENKMLSPEGIDQTDRLYRDFHGISASELFVFLTLDKTVKPKNSNFISLTYEEVLPMLRSLLEDATNADTRFLTKHYLNTLERLIMSEKFECFSERTKLYYQYQKYIEEVNKAFNQDRELLLSALEDGIQHCSWWDGKFWKIEKTGDDITIWKDAWYPSEHEGVHIQLYLHKSEPTFSLYIYGEPSEFSAKFGPTFKRFLDEKHPGKSASGFSKTFAKGVSKFIEKTIPLSLTEKDNVQKILKNLDDMVETFEEIIEKSIKEFKK